MATALPDFLQRTGLSLLIFGGKGGVGKTTCAAAAALRLACQAPERSFFLVSTDPAHSLVDSLGTTPLPANLEVLELDAGACAAEFRALYGEQLAEIAACGTILDEEDIAGLLRLSLPGMDELMAFLRISGWVTARRYDCIILDTAPAGHTLRLLEMPDLMRRWLAALDALLAKHRYLTELYRGEYTPNHLDGLLDEMESGVSETQALLRDPNRCCFAVVLQAEALVIRETTALVTDLEQLGIPVGPMVVNRLIPESDCPHCRQLRVRQAWELVHLRGTFTNHPLWGVPMFPQEFRGAATLRGFWDASVPLDRLAGPRQDLARGHMAACIAEPPRVDDPPPLPSVDARMLFFSGKGGVGKTTLACATALRLAQERPGREILLISTDPAHSISDCIEREIGPSPVRVAPGLTGIELDARAEFSALKEQYREETREVLEAAFGSIDLPFDRVMIERLLDLAPPGLDEVMALIRVMELRARGNYDLLIVDAAPTGHLIRLLEMPEVMTQWLRVLFTLLLKYREVFRLPRISERLVGLSQGLSDLRAMLADPERTSLYAVSILTEMALAETRDLLAACDRLTLHAPVIFLNQVTPPGECPLCSSLHRQESEVGEEFRRTFSNRRQPLVYRLGAPRGIEQLQALGQALFRKADPIACEEKDTVNARG